MTLAADLQDPVEVIPKLLEKWRTGKKVVWGGREQWYHSSLLEKIFAKMFYILVMKMTNVPIPRRGADLVLCDKVVTEAMLKCDSPQQVNIFVLIGWLGFDQDQVLYKRQERKRGQSSWSFSRKVDIVVDTIVGFSLLPIRWYLYFGLINIFLSFAAVGFAAFRYFLTGGVSHWIYIFGLILFVAGLQFCIASLLGEYLWRILKQTQNRPVFIVEADSAKES